jgi:endonuclease YncB( thermonuclease family)
VVDSLRREFVIRLSAIDAPEISQVYGQEAQKALRALVLKKPVVVRGYDLDKYGRILADVEVGGVDVGVHLVGRGLAWHAAHFADDETLSDHQKLAQLLKLGLWQDAKPCPPWQWRHKDAPGFIEPSPINR